MSFSSSGGPRNLWGDQIQFYCQSASGEKNTCNINRFCFSIQEKKRRKFHFKIVLHNLFLYSKEYPMAKSVQGNNKKFVFVKILNQIYKIDFQQTIFSDSCVSLQIIVFPPRFEFQIEYILGEDSLKSKIQILVVA